MKFPDNFVFGGATAAYQCEGNMEKVKLPGMII